MIEEVSERKNGGVQWKCLCSCGKECVVVSSSLVHGLTKSCGHLQKIAAANTGRNNKNDLTGKTFGKLTVIEEDQTRTKDNQVRWICKCSCGNEVSVTGGFLTTGHTRSCGSCGYNIEMRTKNYLEKQNETIIHHGNYCSCEITRGKNAGKRFLFDKCDIEIIKKYVWDINRGGYVRAQIKNPDGNTYRTFLHTLLIEPPDCRVVDHINHNKLDNRRQNLRIATQQENCFNQSIRSDNTSGVKGVSFAKDRNKYHAYIGIDNRIIHLGHYDTLEEATAVRNKAERELFGEFAYIQNEESSEVIELNHEEKEDAS